MPCRSLAGPARDEHHDAALGALETGIFLMGEAGFASEHDQKVARWAAYILAGGRVTVPRAITARAGMYAYDTMTLIGPGTWEAVRGATDAALAAADLVVAGADVAYACCRPPGHHATRTCFGGSCYLNNTAVAAARLRSGLGERVAVIDVDAHHGNGTQEIFYDEAEALVGSVRRRRGLAVGLLANEE